MKNPGKTIRILSVALAFIGSMSWSVMPMRTSGQTTLAATNTMLVDQPAARAVANGRIAFVSGADIYTMNPDGSDRIRLTLTPADQSSVFPIWSPDGTQIAFQRNHKSSQRTQFQQAEVFVMNADGSDQRQITPSGESDYVGTWSPDSSQIALMRNTSDGGSRHTVIYAMQADGRNQTRLTHAVESDGSPTWSPDGTKIAFLRQVNFSTQIGVMNSDGSNQRMICQGDVGPAWSPDSTKLAFTSYDQNGIYVIDADGGNRMPITRPPVNGVFDVALDTQPFWSLDGSKIGFLRSTCDIELANCHGGQIWLVNADGSNSLRLGDNDMTAFASRPIWSPDGTKLVFVEGGDLFLMNADGSGVTNITKTGSEIEDAPTWQALSLVSCADSISATAQTIDAEGGSGSVDVTAGDECRWSAASYASWITLASGGSSNGNGTVSYSVAPNDSTTSRSGLLFIASRSLVVTQTGALTTITSASVEGKKLFVVGEHFDLGAVILINGEEQITKNSPQDAKTMLIGKKAGKRIRSGDRLQVRNPNGTVSQEFTFGVS